MRPSRLALQHLALAACVCAFATQPRPAAGKTIVFDNTKPRLGSDGAILRAHDGTTQRFGDKGPYFCALPHCSPQFETIDE